MSIAAVICEFNPFHNGHKYLLSEIKNQGYDTIICIMSGSFTQRGEVAVTDKYTRTLTALKNGADLIIELPSPFAVSCAQRFAKGGVSIIKALGIVDKVFFGSECADIELIKKAALATENPKVCQRLKEYMNDGAPYPVALQKAVENIFGKETADVLSSPNNTLGVEYTKELMGSDIEVGTICRKGAEHDSKETDGGFASASLIRNKILSDEDISAFVPDYRKEDFQNPARESFGERAVILKLKSMSKEELAKVADISEGLENRLFAAIRESSGLEELYSKVKTKRYTLARLRRIVCCALLGITEKLQTSEVSYIRVLGATDKGLVALKEASKSASLPIITSTASALREQEDHLKEMLMCDINATDIRTVFEKEISPSGKDFTGGFVRVSE